MFKFIKEYFWLLFILGILAGIFLPFSSLITPYILYMLMFTLFLSCLNIDISRLVRKIRDLRLVIYLVFLILIVVPLLFYFIFNSFLESEYSLAILILLAMPTGMTTPLYVNILKGDNELALIIVTITSLLSTLTIPFLIYFLVGIQTNINFIQMFTTLSMIIFIPFILSILFRRIGKRIIDNTKKYYSSISILIITFIMAGAIAKVNFIQIISNDKSIIYPFFLLFVLAILLHIIGYYVVYKKDNKTKITSSLAIAYMNSTLAIVFAAQFFNPKTLLLVVLYQIPTNLVLICFGYIVNKYLYNEINA